MTGHSEFQTAAKGKSDDLDIPDGMEPAPIGA